MAKGFDGRQTGTWPIGGRRQPKDNPARPEDYTTVDAVTGNKSTNISDEQMMISQHLRIIREQFGIEGINDIKKKQKQS